MGKNGFITSIDAINGTTATETVHFAIDGVHYEIDLSSANAKVLRRTVTQWARCGRKVDAPQSRRHTRVDPWRNHVVSLERNAIREWCVGNGYRVGSRGPLPFHVVDAFRAANSGR